MEIEIFGKQIYFRKEIIVTVSVLVVLISGIIGYVIKANGGEVIDSKETIADKYITQMSSTTSNMKTVESESINKPIKESEQIKVYVVGCVNKSGVVTLEKGQIIDDAIKAAGGATKEADLENINLAYELNENTMLKILSKKETQNMGAILKSQVGNQDSKAPNKAMVGVKIIKDSGGAVVNNNSEPQTTEKAGKININNAKISELDTLPGIGEKTASDIIAYREKSGNFKKIEDIMNVPGIGEGKFSKMKELITVE